jgi:hypothetical protein
MEGGIKISEPQEISNNIINLIDNKKLSNSIQQCALNVVKRNQGSLVYTVSLSKLGNC